MHAQTSGGGGPRVIHLAPSPDLARFVKHLTVVESELGMTRSLIPGTGLSLGVRYRGAADELRDGEAARLPDAVLTGVRKAARLVRTSRGGGIVLVVFRECGASAFFRLPLHQLFDASVALADLLPRAEVARLQERIAAATGDRERAARVEEFLRARLLADVDAVAAAAATAIVTSGGTMRIDAIARAVGLSRDRLEKRFRAAAGATPKRLAAIARMQRAIAHHRPGTSLTRLAVDAGYYDQSHFIREFRAFTGSAPRHFFASVPHC